MKKKKHILYLIIAAILLSAWILWGNCTLEITSYTVSSSRIPAAFSGFRIIQISDLHNAEFGKENEKLVSVIMHTEPDIIVLTGDLIDSRNTDIEIALSFVRKITEIAPVYYVSGNHEARVREYTDLKTGMEKSGAVVLENEKVKVERNGSSITLMGIADPSFETDYLFGDARYIVDSRISELQEVQDGYTILLSHRPEQFQTYVDRNVDLVFSGHAHGGQFRIPFIGGLFAPNQGFFPKYDGGEFQEGNTTMLVSRGVGNSLIPIRIHNPPEIIVAQLHAQ